MVLPVDGGGGYGMPVAPNPKAPKVYGTTTSGSWYDQLVNPPAATATPTFGGTAVQLNQPVAVRPAPTTTPTGQYTNLNFGSDIVGGGSGGGGVGGAFTPPVQTPQLSPEDWLNQDDIYKALLTRLNHSESAFDADRIKQTDLINTNATEQQQNYEDGRAKALDQLLAQMASRGAVNSTGYGEFIGDTNKTFDDYLSGVDKNKTNALTGLENAYQSLHSNDEDLRGQAKAEALARRLATYGIKP